LKSFTWNASVSRSASSTSSTSRESSPFSAKYPTLNAIALRVSLPETRVTCACATAGASSPAAAARTVARVAR
jgi:hypothetical protein